MGNRALIIGKGSNVGIYLHWNGGRDSVEAFLRWAELSKLPSIENRGEIALAAVIANFFGNDGNSISLETVNRGSLQASAPYDNGIYIVENHQIVGRIKPPRIEQRGHDLTEMLILIDGRQPERDKLGTQFLLAEERPTAELTAGERVFIRDPHGEEKYVVRTVLGHINGTPLRRPLRQPRQREKPELARPRTRRANRRLKPSVAPSPVWGGRGYS